MRANPNSVMMTRPKYNPADYAITPAYRMAEIKASEAKSQIERNRAYNDAQAKATVAQRQLAAKVAEIERYNAQAQRNAQNAQASYMAASAAAATVCACIWRHHHSYFVGIHFCGLDTVPEIWCQSNQGIREEQIPWTLHKCNSHCRAQETSAAIA